MDKAILDFLYATDFPILTTVLKIITYMGDKGIIWLLIIGILFIMKKRKLSMTMLFSLTYMQVISNGFIKNTIMRPRPFTTYPYILKIIEPTGYSYPSGHTASSFACALVVFYYNKKAGIAAFVFASLMAFSRLYFVVHYPTDILAGVVVGLICGLLAIITGNKIWEFFHKATD